MILGNDLAGNHVWADGSPPAETLLKEKVFVNRSSLMSSQTSCAVTQAMTR